jgi:hypothetical protein
LTQISLGQVLKVRGERTDGDAGIKLLDEAAKAFRLALTVYTREHMPLMWVETQNNLGDALKEQGMRLDRETGAKLLNQAADAYRLALTVYRREHMPLLWARTQNNLGDALKEQGTRRDGDAGAKLLAQAADAHRLALKVYTRVDFPEDWGITQHNLGSALATLGARTEGDTGAKLLVEATDAFRSALNFYTREQAPQNWVLTQKNLGITLQLLAVRHGFPRCLELVGELINDHGIRNDPATQSSLLALAVACHAASGDEAAARRTLSNLLALIDHQPDNFHLVWNWGPLQEAVAKADAKAVKAYRKPLLRLLDAVSRDKRQAILDGLKEVQGGFSGKAEDPKTAP